MEGDDEMQDLEPGKQFIKFNEKHLVNKATKKINYFKKQIFILFFYQEINNVKYIPFI